MGEVGLEGEDASRGRHRKKGKTKGRGHKWYEEGGKYESVLYVQATAEGELKRKAEEIVKKIGLKVKVLERSGRSLKSLLQRSDPFSTRLCGREGCVLCGCNSEIDCRERDCVYSIKCFDCEEEGVLQEYRGQSGRVIGERIDEQFKYWERKEKNNPLTKHSVKAHDGRKFEVDIGVKAKCYGKPSRRLITEAVMIEGLGDMETMNSKSEWAYVNLKKL